MKDFATRILLWIYYTVLLLVVTAASPFIFLAALLTDGDRRTPQ